MHRIDYQFHDKVLADLALAGVGVHHAGLSFDDRRATEDLYLKKILRVIVSTSVSLKCNAYRQLLIRCPVDSGRWCQSSYDNSRTTYQLRTAQTDFDCLQPHTQL